MDKNKFSKENLEKYADFAITLFETVKKVYDKVKETLSELDIEINKKYNIVNFKSEMFNKEQLIKLVSENKVDGSNEACAIMEKNPDGGYKLFLAYSKDRELLPEDVNTYVVITVTGYVAQDVRDLFGDEKLIILK